MKKIMNYLKTDIYDEQHNIYFYKTNYGFDNLDDLEVADNSDKNYNNIIIFSHECFFPGNKEKKLKHI